MAQPTTIAGHTPIAIIGMSCLFPKAQSLQEYWANICNRVDAITEIPESHWRAADYFDADPKRPDFTYARRGGFLSPVPFDPTEFGIAPNALEAIDTAQLLSLTVAQAALADAGYPREREFDRDRVSVILGVTGTLELVIPLGARLGHPQWRRALKEAGVDDQVAEDVVRRIADCYVNWQEDSFPGLLGNVVAGRIANRFNFGGTNCVVDAACASSLSAAHMATMELTSGRADMVITGGVDTFNDIFMYMCFSKTPALSPTGDSRPFSADADGTILGEGIGMVVLKRLADAERDGDRICAVIKGIGTSSDGRGKAIYTPSANGQLKALRAAYAQARVSPASVELVEAHGTGTKVGDATEVAALREVYSESDPCPTDPTDSPLPPAGDPKPSRSCGDGSQGSGVRAWCALGSVKSQIGHTKAAAGVAAIIKAALALQHKILPPTIKVDEVNPATNDGPFYVITQKRPWLPSAHHPRRAAVSSFGFGGSNFHAVLEEHDAHKARVDWDGSVQIVALSAPSLEGLHTKLTAFALTRREELGPAAARSRREFACEQAYRLTLVIESDNCNLQNMCADVQSKLAQHSEGPAWAIESYGSYGGAYFSSRPAGKLGVLFPGQGAQYVGMGLDLACHFPQMQKTLAAANEAFGRSRLTDFLFPPPPTDSAAKRANEAALQATSVAQPALGAVSLGTLRVLASFGVKPEAVAGHSYGELVALCAAGRYDSATLHQLSRIRGELMSQGNDERGSMLAVKATQAEVERVLDDENLTLVIANKNAPNQVVLSGETPEIQRAAAAFKRRSVSTTALAVAAAFHSHLVAGAAAPFHAALEEIEFAPASIPVFANTTGEIYPDDPVAARDLLGHQLARPVEFVAQIENMHNAGVRTFLEVGPGARLSGLVKSILSDRDHDALAVDASKGRVSGWLGLARILAQLATLGHGVDLRPWQDGEAELAVAKRPQRMTIKISGANYRAAASNGSKTKTVNKSTSATPAAKQVSSPSSLPLPPALLAEPSPPLPAAPSATTAPTMLQALGASQEGLAALLKLQEQTAQLHRQFLEGQELAQENLRKLIEQQQRLFEQATGLPSAATVAPAHVTSVGEVAETEAEVAIVPTEGAGANGSSPPPSRLFEEALLQIVSERTGYPVEMLDLDMDIESDLGIDSIKRVEILSETQVRLPQAPVVQPEQLSEFRTLRRVIEFLSSSPGGNGHVSASDGVSGEIERVLLNIVAQKTGYPVEMLDLEMDMESDLGIDSIKRVEIMSEAQARLQHAAVVPPEQLGEFRTLGQVIGFLSASLPSVIAAAPTMAPNGGTGPAHSPPSNGDSQSSKLSRRVLTAAPLSDAARNRIELTAGAEVWITRDEAGVAVALAELLDARGFRSRLIAGRRFPKIKKPSDLAALVIVASPGRQAGDDLWAIDCEQLLKTSFELTRYAGPKLRESAGRSGALFVTVSRLDGAFGLAQWAREFDPIQGGLAGLCKTIHHEWPEVTCKAIDLAHDITDAGNAAQLLVDEMLLAGPLEVGIGRAGLRQLQEIESPLCDFPLTGPLRQGDVVVVTGGGRGVTAESAIALAQACQPTLVLLGRTPPPNGEPDWLGGLQDERSIKRAILMQANGNGLTPARVDEEYRCLLASREIARNVDRMEEAGARVLYRAVDIRNEAAVHKALNRVQGEHGPIRGIIHGAGVLADRLIGDKTDEQFARVFETKVRGLRALLQCVDAAELKCLALFSSVTARYGRAGQVDYAMANEALNKIARQQAALHPHCRVVAINWGPWRGGMVNAALSKLFQSQGVDLIPLGSGAQTLVNELGASDRAVEVIIGGKSATRLSEFGSPMPAGNGGSNRKSSNLSIAFERELEVDQYPFLASHLLKRAPVLPAAMMMEWMAHAALHENPGFLFHGVDDFRVLKGVTLSGGSYPIRVCSSKATQQGATATVTVELRGGNMPEVVHARAEVILASRLPRAVTGLQPPRGGQVYMRTVAEAYRDVLFHGPHFQGIERIEGCSEEGIVALVATAPSPSTWMREPLRSSWLTDPLAVDAAFQLMILWTHEHHGEVSLPTYVKSYRQYQPSFPRAGVRTVVRAARSGGNRARADIEFVSYGSYGDDSVGSVGNDGSLVARMDACECVMAASLMDAFQR